MVDDWKPCQRCGSNRVQAVSKWVAVIALFSSAGCMIWVGILFPPLWIAVPILLILSVLAMIGKDTWQCQDCKHTWIKKKTKN